MSETPTSTQEDKDDAALGRTVRSWGSEVLDKFKVHIALALLASLLGWGGREATHLQTAQVTPEEVRSMVAGIRQIHQDLVEVKVETQAVVDSLPQAERDRAKGLIADRMAVLRLADERGTPQ